MEKINEHIDANYPFLTGILLGIPYWAWIGLPLILLGSFFLGRIFSEILIRIATAALNRFRSSSESLNISYLKNPTGLFLTGILFSGTMGFLPFEGTAHNVAMGLGMLLTVYGITWAALRLISSGGIRLRGYFLAHGQVGAAALIPLMDKILKVLLVAIAGLFLLQNFGFDVIAIITALGIGGIAIALASQKSVENIFGGAMLSLDQPVRVGDFCRWNGQVGTVEDIGLRSTKIRTLDRTVVAVPNAELSNIEIENFAAREKILLKKIIGLRYETTPDQIRFIILSIRKFLLGHPKVEDEPARVRFVAFNDYSLDIEIFAYVRTSDYGHFLEVQEDIFLHIIDIIKEAGSDFAFPSQTIYVEQGTGLPQEQQNKIGETIQRQRKANDLDWPDLSDEKREKILNKLRYPASM